MGGPVWIPKIYNGHDKTFFFFNFEQFREALGIIQLETVPTAAYRAGNFATAIPAGAAPIGTDPGGNPIFQGEIFDPTTSLTAANGTVYRDSFSEQHDSRKPLRSGRGENSEFLSRPCQQRDRQQLHSRHPHDARHADPFGQDRSGRRQ